MCGGTECASQNIPICCKSDWTAEQGYSRSLWSRNWVHTSVGLGTAIINQGIIKTGGFECVHWVWGYYSGRVLVGVCPPFMFVCFNVLRVCKLQTLWSLLRICCFGWKQIFWLRSWMPLDSVAEENIRIPSDLSDHAYGAHTCSSHLTWLPSSPRALPLLLKISLNKLPGLISTLIRAG